MLRNDTENGTRRNLLGKNVKLLGGSLWYSTSRCFLEHSDERVESFLAGGNDLVCRKDEAVLASVAKLVRVGDRLPESALYPVRRTSGGNICMNIEFSHFFCVQRDSNALQW